MSDKCPVCNSEVKNPERLYSDSTLRYLYSCQRCGDYLLENYFKDNLPSIIKGDHKKIAVLSHWVRSQHEANLPDDSGRRRIPLLDQALVDTILKEKPPNPAEQADNFVRWIGDKIEASGRYGEYVGVNGSIHQAIIGAMTPDQFKFIFNHLCRTIRRAIIYNVYF